MSEMQRSAFDLPSFQLARIKEEVLCYGIRVEDSAVMEKIREQNPFQESSSGMSAGWYIDLTKEGRTTFTNASVYFDYAARSPFTVQEDKGNYFLMRDNLIVASVSPMPAPEWYGEKTSSGMPMNRVFVQHGRNALVSVIYSECQLFYQKKECGFCQIDKSKKRGSRKNQNERDLQETVNRALQYNPDYQIDLKGGTTYSRGTGLEIFIEKVEAIRQVAPENQIVVEASPPLDNVFLDQLLEVGGNVIMMNLEIWDEKRRKEICPGKSELIPRERYFEALSYAVEIFGEGNVSSCLIAGLESADSTIQGARALAEMGVIVSILPYRPLNPQKIPETILEIGDFRKINNALAAINSEFSLDPRSQPGCSGCGGCALETDLMS